MKIIIIAVGALVILALPVILAEDLLHKVNLFLDQNR